MVVFARMWYVKFSTSGPDITLLDPDKYMFSAPATLYKMVQQILENCNQYAHLETQHVVIYSNPEIITGLTF